MAMPWIDSAPKIPGASRTTPVAKRKQEGTDNERERYGSAESRREAAYGACETAVVHDEREHDRRQNDSEYQLASTTLCEFSFDVRLLGLCVIHRRLLAFGLAHRRSRATRASHDNTEREGRVRREIIFSSRDASSTASFDPDLVHTP